MRNHKMKKYHEIITKELNKILPYHLLGVIFHTIVIYIAFKIPECIGNILDMLMQTTVNKEQIMFQVYCLLFYSSFVFVPRLLYRICYFTISRKADTYLRKKVIEHLQKVKPDYFEKENKGVFLAYLSKEVLTIRKILGNFWFYITKMCITPIMAVILICTQLNKQLAMYLIIIIPVAIVAMFYQYKKLRKKIEVSRKVYIDLSKNIEQNTDGFLLIKSYNRQQEQKANFNCINNKMYQADYEIGVVKNKISNVINLLYACSYTIGFGIGILFLDKGMLTVGALVTFMGYINQFLGDFISGMQSFLERMPYYQLSLNRFNYFLNLEETPKGKEELEQIKLIQIKNLSYWYANEEKPALKNITMTIKKGEKIGIIGQVGSGKTTLMNILAGFYEIPTGMVDINGKDITTYKKSSIFKKYNYAIQENIVLDSTIKANINITEKLEEEEVQKIIKKAELQDDIQKFEKREDTLVGEKGVKLSGGQKQRISIARNLGEIREVNIFDDTLSALDSNTEKRIMDTLVEEVGDNTLIFISNKISNVTKLDKIYVLLEGRIQDQGTHEELMKRNTFYQELELLERKEEADERYCQEKC